MMFVTMSGDIRINRVGKPVYGKLKWVMVHKMAQMTVRVREGKLSVMSSLN